uniref:Ionotropic glutamate receptor L-glutamate and glycine-binding domain-containing protein n=1 Tax=Anopheles atroparvus TaxID=41427 RepID=A0A182J7B5_ANOAO
MKGLLSRPPVSAARRRSVRLPEASQPASVMAVRRDRLLPLASLLLAFVPSFCTSTSPPAGLLPDKAPQQLQQHPTVALWWDERVDAIFAPVDRIDVVNGENAAAAPLLRRRTVRWYSAGPDTLCADARPTVDACRPEGDRFERFRLHWAANAHGGYIIFGSEFELTALLAGYGCLFDPAGTYLFVGHSPLPQPDRLPLLALLRQIWSERGVYRVFVRLRGGEIVTYDPFQPPLAPSSAPEYGALVSLAVGDPLPSVPADDFRGYPLRVEMFRSVYTNPVASETAPAGTGYTGADVTARDAFQQALNVTVVHVPADKDLFGYRQPNGSFSGALGRLVRREVDIVFTGFFVKDYFTRDVEFTASVYSDAVCCLVRKASRIPEALLPLFIFPADIWALLALLGPLCALVWGALRLSVRRLYRHRSWPPWMRHRRLAVLFNLSRGVQRASTGRRAAQLLIDAFLLLLSAPYQRFTRSGVERLFLAGLLLVSLVFVSLYQSGLAAVFVNPLHYPDIGTLQQLEATGMAIPVKYRGFLDDVFPVNYSRLMDALRARMQYLRVPESMLARVARLGTIATVTRRSTLALDNAIYIATRQLHLVPECPRTYNLAYVTPRRSALAERFNRVLLRLVGGGLLEHWIDAARHEWTLRDRPVVQRMGQSDFKVLTVLDMQFALYVLAIGLALSALTLGLELLRHRRSRPPPREHPPPRPPVPAWPAQAGHVAGVRSLAGVDALVLSQIVLPVELAAAHLAVVALVRLVLARVPQPVVLPDELAPAVVARLVVKCLLQMLHENTSRPSACVSMWRRMLALVYGCWQTVHGSVLFSSFAYLSVCERRTWRVKLFWWMNFSRQYGHGFGFWSCVSLCHSILARVGNTSPHCEQTYSCFTIALFRWYRLLCWARFENRLKCRLQSLQRIGACPVCTRICSISFCLMTKCFPHTRHPCSLMPRWRFRCSVKLRHCLK